MPLSLKNLLLEQSTYNNFVNNSVSYFRQNELHCKVDVHLNVHVSSDSSVTVTPKVHCKNSDQLSSDNEIIKSKSKKKKQCHQRTNSYPGNKKSQFESVV